MGLQWIRPRHASTYYAEPRFPPPGSTTAKVFNGIHKTVTLSLVGCSLLMGTYIVTAAVKHKRSRKPPADAVKSGAE